MYLLVLYRYLACSDAAVAKVLRLSEIAQVARSEGRLRRFLLAAWNTRVKRAVEEASRLAMQRRSTEQIAAAVRREMSQWELDALPVLTQAIDGIYRLARIAGWKKATNQTLASLGYDTPNMTEILKAARKPPRPGFKVMPAFDVRDENAIQALQNQQVLWVGDHYDKNVAAGIRMGVGDAIRQGQTRAAAGKNVSRYLTGFLGQVRTPTGFNGTVAQYMEGLAASAATTARAFGQMSSFAQVGFTQYTVVNPMDRRTCPVCSAMNGRTFTVSQGTQTMQHVLDAKTPDDVRAAQPWRSDDTGKRITVTDLQRIAPDRSRGSSDALAGKGFNLPPFHFRCRCAVDVEPGAVENIDLRPQPPPTPKKPPIPKTKPPVAKPPTVRKPKPPTAPKPPAPPPIPQTPPPLRPPPKVKYPDTVGAPAPVFSKKELKGHIAAIREGFAPRGAKSSVRSQLNALIRDEGVPVRDVLNKLPSRGVVTIVPDRLMGRALASHVSATGEVRFRATEWKRLKNYFAGKRTGSKRALHTLIHEAFHGASPARHSAYQGMGLVIEEITTDYASYRVALKRFGFSARDIMLLKNRNDYGTWERVAERTLVDVVKKHSQKTVSAEAAADLLEEASIAYKRLDKTLVGVSQVKESFAQSVQWPEEIFAGMPKAKAEALRERLRDEFMKEWESKIRIK